MPFGGQARKRIPRQRMPLKAFQVFICHIAVRLQVSASFPSVGFRLLVALRRFRTVNARFCIVNYRFAFSISSIFVRGDFFAASVM